MPEMANAGEDHGKPRIIRSLDHLVIPHGATGLDDGRCSCLCCLQQTIGEREEGI